MTTWFVSDIHVSDERPDIRDAFVTFLSESVQGASALYVLGDLFESWVGDDDPDPSKRAAVDAIRALSDDGTACFFCHGNRDFMVGGALADMAGFALMEEEHVLEIGGERVLLMHGDSLCVDDHEYMAVRKQVRDPQWQAQIRSLPLAQRQALAASARQQSRTDMAIKPEDIMDVNRNAVLDAMSRHDVRRLIHGHTHRPDTHALENAGKKLVRHVLGDWYEQGDVLVHDENGFRRLRLSAGGHCES
ncbi:MAG: UDP-2,3-diacylglucosamine diphosphatase [Pseudomonadota bacterium]